MKFDEICIESSVKETELARRIMARTAKDRIRFVSGKEELLHAGDGGDARGSSPPFKRRIFITRERGRFLRRCPGTPGMRCCNLFVLNPVVGCPYDCTYCFLQAYQNEPWITLHANIEDLEREVEALKGMNPGRLLRICIGELSDSLALEPLAAASSFLVERFSRMENVLLELKTKSDRIDHLLGLDHQGRTVVSWSLNPDPVALPEERGAPPPGARLNAASRIARAGYWTAFHFDPIVRFEGWREAYGSLVKELFRAVPARSIQWISLGGFRYTPEMKALILRRFPCTKLFLEEFLPGPDGKYRYFSRHRIELYRTLLACIRGFSADLPVYLCMEADFVWRKVFKMLPGESRLLDPLFSGRHG